MMGVDQARDNNMPAQIMHLITWPGICHQIGCMANSGNNIIFNQDGGVC